MRQRIEDLGRIAVMIRNLLDLDIFEDRLVRNKDYAEWFEQKTEDEREDILREWVYRTDNLKEKIYDILEIAEGQDYLNEPKET